jgi:hypothetical protein
LRAERSALAWRAVDQGMRPKYGDSDDDTDEEYDATTGELIDDAEKSMLLIETHTTATVVHDAMVA